jgi:hypothetical protein
MLVSEMKPGNTFKFNGQEYIKVQPKFNEELCLEVKHDGKTYYVASNGCAAVNLENGDLEFIKDDISNEPEDFNMDLEFIADEGDNSYISSLI